MLYPARIHRDDDSAYGAELPDFPGCFAASDEWEGLPEAIREAVSLYCEGEDMDIPLPSRPELEDGNWIFVDIDTAALSPKSQRINVSVPTAALRRIDHYVEHSGRNRSELMVEATQLYITEQVTPRNKRAGYEGFMANTGRRFAAAKKAPAKKKVAKKKAPAKKRSLK